jgi:hypothetical protein
LIDRPYVAIEAVGGYIPCYWLRPTLHELPQKRAGMSRGENAGLTGRGDVNFSWRMDFLYLSAVDKNPQRFLGCDWPRDQYRDWIYTAYALVLKNAVHL